jgi:Tol biopolymer transport system component
MEMDGIDAAPGAAKGASMVGFVTSRTLIAGLAVLTLLSVTTPAAAAADDVDLAFASGDLPDDMIVYVADAGGTSVQPVTGGHVGDFYYQPKAWSPDGSQIAHVSSISGSQKLYTVNVDGTGTTEVCDGPFELALGFAWSPDGTSIAFTSDRGGNPDLYLVEVATGVVRNLSNDPGDTGVFRWSPSGARLAYESGTGPEGRRDVYIVPAAGGTPVNVTRDDVHSPLGAWSPDESTYLYVADRQGTSQILLADADGSHEASLSNDAAGATGPIWSPDGSRIAYSAGDPGRIHVMNADGTGKRRVTDGSIDHDRDLDYYTIFQTVEGWSHDGSRLAVGAHLSGYGPHQHLFGLYVLDVDGTTPPLKVAEGGGSPSVTWSADGHALIVRETGNYGIDGKASLAAAGGGPVTHLVTGTNASASWSPDGAHLMYSAGGAAPSRHLYVADADGTDAIDIAAGLPGPYTFSAAWRPQRQGPVGLVDPDTGRWMVRNAWGWTRSFFYGDPGDVPFLGDWDCDGEETPGLFRPTDGYVYLRNTNTQGVADISYYFGNPADVPLAGDFDGDGCDTVSLYRPAEGKVYVIDRLGSSDRGLGAADYSYYFGNPGDKPFAGDFDGDGVDTVGLHRESSGFVYLRQSNTHGIADAEFFYGNPGDHIIAGDWTADGVDTVGVFRPSEHRFYLNHHNTAGAADQAFWMGRGDWIPITGNVHPDN